MDWGSSTPPLSLTSPVAPATWWLRVTGGNLCPAPVRPSRPPPSAWSPYPWPPHHPPGVRPGPGSPGLGCGRKETSFGWLAGCSHVLRYIARSRGIVLQTGDKTKIPSRSAAAATAAPAASAAGAAVAGAAAATTAGATATATTPSISVTQLRLLIPSSPILFSRRFLKDAPTQSSSHLAPHDPCFSLDSLPIPALPPPPRITKPGWPLDSPRSHLAGQARLATTRSR